MGYSSGVPWVEDVGGDVPDQMVHRIERCTERDGERLRGADADHEGAGEAGAGCDGDRVEIAQCDPGLGERRLDRRGERLEVGPGRDLGDDSAIARVLVHAAGDRVAQRSAADDADAGLVAARLDAQHEGFGAVHVHAPASAEFRVIRSGDFTGAGRLTPASS